VALESRPGLLATVQRDLEAAIGELNHVVLRTGPSRLVSAVCVRSRPRWLWRSSRSAVLRICLAKVVYQRPSEAVRERIEAAKGVGLIHQTSTSLHEVRDKARQQDLVSLLKMLADVEDPQKPNTGWANREATQSFLRQEIAAIREMLEPSNRGRRARRRRAQSVPNLYRSLF
jgi:hypothetical protein